MIRTSDLPLFYILVAVQVAVILCLPVAGWVLIRFVANLPGSRLFLVPALAVVVLVIEVAMIWRVRRLLSRLRSARRSP
jgi:hypothetical protein